MNRPESDKALPAGEAYDAGAMPPEVEWLANFGSAQTARAYRADIRDFSASQGIASSEDLKKIRRPHVIAWRKELEGRGHFSATICRKLAALSSLCLWLMEAGVLDGNPVAGVRRPAIGARNRGATPAISDDQVAALLSAPDPETTTGKRDRAILATFCYHGIRCAELCSLTGGDVHEIRGFVHLAIHGKGGKTRYVPLHREAEMLIDQYLEYAGHRGDKEGPLFRPVTKTGRSLRKPIGKTTVSSLVREYGRLAGIEVPSFGPHSLRATAATHALEAHADLGEVQEWLGHSSITTTRMYDRRRHQPENSPTFKIDYSKKKETGACSSKS